METVINLMNLTINFLNLISVKIFVICKNYSNIESTYILQISVRSNENCNNKVIAEAK